MTDINIDGYDENGDLALDEDEWDEQPEDPRSRQDLEAADAAIRALQGWKRRRDWRNREVDHFRTQVRRYAGMIAEQSPLGTTERRELKVLRGKVEDLEREIKVLRSALKQEEYGA